jgi:hypothetical protein
MFGVDEPELPALRQWKDRYSSLVYWLALCLYVWLCQSSWWWCVQDSYVRYGHGWETQNCMIRTWIYQSTSYPNYVYYHGGFFGVHYGWFWFCVYTRTRTRTRTDICSRACVQTLTCIHFTKPRHNNTWTWRCFSQRHDKQKMTSWCSRASFIPPTKEPPWDIFDMHVHTWLGNVDTELIAVHKQIAHYCDCVWFRMRV